MVRSLLRHGCSFLLSLSVAATSARLEAQMVEAPRVGLPDASQSLQQGSPPSPAAPSPAVPSPAVPSLMNSPEANPSAYASGGIQNQAGASQAGASQAGPPSESLMISSGDLVEIVVFDTPELSNRLRVNNHGDILLPLAGYVHIAGMTAPEAAREVGRKLVDTQILLHPQVTLNVLEFAAQGVTMAGEIRTPGVYPLRGSRTLLDMVTLAGGLGPSASQVISIIHRDDPGKVITVRMNVTVQTPETFAAESYPVLPGDTIFVARSGIVYVVGDLKTPGGFQVEHNERLTLLDAVALAGGPTPTSKLTDARLIRKGQNGREQMQLDLKKILYGSGPDVLLQDGDILFVPVSQRKIYTQQAIQAAIGAASQYGLFKISTQ